MQINGKSQVLIIDDHAGVREMVAALVEELGHRPHAVETGEDGLSILGDGGVDLLLTDLKLPGIDGLEVLKRARKVSPLTPVILLTGYPTVDHAIRAIKLGACDFIAKPFKIEALERAITRALNEKRLVEENQRLMAEANKVAVIQRLNTTLNQKLHELMSLNRIGDVLTAAEDNETLFGCVVDLASDLTGAERVSLMLVTPDADALTIRTARGISDHVVRESRVPLGTGIAGQVALQRQPLMMTKQSTAPFATRPGVYRGPAFISVPMVISNEVLGVLNLSEKAGGEDFTDAEFSLMQALAEKAAIRVENNALYESIYCNLIDTLTSLVTTLEAKDPYTKEHSRRVTDMAAAIGRELGLSDDDIESINFAGMLHDIGKIGVSDGILLKPARLTEAEFEVIKMHPVIGEQIVEPLGLIQAERNIIRSHHERLDGSGYPDGLTGDEIPLLARIVAAADAFDAMTSTRPYRRAKGRDYALDELARTRGLHYDPDVVDALNRVLDAQAGGVCLAGQTREVRS